MDDPGVHHDRLDDHPGDLVRVLVQQPGDAAGVVEAGDQRELDERAGDAGAGGGLGRLAFRAGLVGLGGDGDLDRVVVPVVAALDLDDQVPAGDRPHQVDGVHRGLGARVGEPPQRLGEPGGEFAGDRHGVRGGLGEMGAAGDLAAYRLDDGGVRVPGQPHAVAAVQVHVLVAVDVIDLGTEAV